MTRLLHLQNPLNLWPPVLGSSGHDPQVLGHLDLAAAVGVAAEDENLAFRMAVTANPGWGGWVQLG